MNYTFTGKIFIKIDDNEIRNQLTDGQTVKTSPYFVEPLSFFLSHMTRFIESAKKNKEDSFNGEDFTIMIRPIILPTFEIIFEHTFHEYEVHATINYEQFKNEVLREYKKTVDFMKTIKDGNIQNLLESKDFYKIYEKIKNFD